MTPKSIWKRVLTVSAYCSVGIGIGVLVSPVADPIKAVTYWLIVNLMGVSASFALKSKYFQSSARTKHVQWTKLAHHYAGLLEVEPRDVWIAEEESQTWLARAESDRILVNWARAQLRSDEVMSFIIAHEVAHYVPKPRVISRLLVHVLGVAAFLCVSIFPWLAIAIVFPCQLLITGGLVVYEARKEEYRADALAVSITSPQMAMAAYPEVEYTDKLWFLRKSPSFNARRRAIILGLKDFYKLQT